MKETVTVLNQALLTEKATMLSANLNKYSFTVAPSASRTNVKTAVENAFGVKVLKVNIMNVNPNPKEIARGETSRVLQVVPKRQSLLCRLATA